MPTATEFTALGAGNGFTLCPSVVNQNINVSAYDYWTTLSGWSKENEPSSEADKKESIAQSRKNAMKLFWNANSITGSSSLGDSSNYPDPVYSSSKTLDLEQGDYTNVNWMPLDGNTAVTGANKEPYERVCYRSWSSDLDLDSIPDGGPPDYPVGVDSEVYLRSSIISMYDGPTDNPANFVGYGSFPARVKTYTQGFYFYGDLNLGSFFNDRNVEYFFINNRELVTFSGMSFYADFYDAANWHNGDAVFTTTNNEVKVDVAVPDSSGGTLKISNLDFYTY